LVPHLVRISDRRVTRSRREVIGAHAIADIDTKQTIRFPTIIALGLLTKAFQSR